MTKLAFATLVNKPLEFEACRSSLTDSAGVRYDPPWTVVTPNKFGWNAAQGLNAAMQQMTGDWFVLTHQDVRFPPGWLAALEEEVASLPPEVCVVGVVGSTAHGFVRGHINDPNGHCFWPPARARVLTLDECVLVLRASADLCFDETVPGFHCYGADLCLTAQARGLEVWSLDLPITHLSTGRIDATYDQAAAFLLDKWGDKFHGVIPTPAKVLWRPGEGRRPRTLLLRTAARWARHSRNRDCSSALCSSSQAAHAETDPRRRHGCSSP